MSEILEANNDNNTVEVDFSKYVHLVIERDYFDSLFKKIIDNFKDKQTLNKEEFENIALELAKQHFKES